MACAQALLWPGRGRGRASPGRAAHRPVHTSGCAGTAHLSSPAAPVPGCPFLAPLPSHPALTSWLLHPGCGSGSWEDWLVAQRSLSASILCFTIRTNAPQNYLWLHRHFWRGSGKSPHPALHGARLLLAQEASAGAMGSIARGCGWWETCGAAPQPSSTRWHPLHRGGDGTACTEACTEVWQGPCPGQVGTRCGVTTAGELEPCCSLQERGFCKSWVLVKARGWHKLFCHHAFPYQGFTSQ